MEEQPRSGGGAKALGERVCGSEGRTCIEAACSAIHALDVKLVIFRDFCGSRPPSMQPGNDAHTGDISDVLRKIAEQAGKKKIAEQEVWNRK